MPHSQIGSINLYHERTGTGPTVLLLSGMASDSASWRPVLPTLQQHYSLITMDNRCTGQTLPNPVETSRELMVADIVALLDHLELDRVAVVGHSMGAMLGWALCAAVPHRVAALVAAAAPPQTLAARVDLFKSLAAMRSEHNELAWFRVLFQFLFSPSFFEDSAAVSDAALMAVHYPHKQPIDALQTQASALQSFLNTPAIDHPHCPVLAMTGSNDLLFSPAAMTDAYTAYPDVSSVVVDNAAHALHWENPEDFCQNVIEFLDTHWAAEAGAPV